MFLVTFHHCCCSCFRTVDPLQSSLLITIKVDHRIPLLRSSHCLLPVCQRIDFSTSQLVYRASNGLEAKAHFLLFCHITKPSSRPLRSSGTALLQRPQSHHDTRDQQDSLFMLQISGTNPTEPKVC